MSGAGQGRYHHGSLRRALLDAAAALAGEVGPERVAMREVARRAGVSSAAPFRHFADRTALMTAVAEEAMARLRTAVEASLEAVVGAPPSARLKAVGRAYLDWVRENPAQFQIVSARRQIDFDGSAILTGDNAVLQTLMDGAIAALGRPASGPRAARIAARALVYGLARMQTDGHFASWGVGPEELTAVEDQVLDLFIRCLGGA